MELFDVQYDEVGVKLSSMMMCADCMAEMMSICKNLYECPRCRMHYYEGK